MIASGSTRLQWHVIDKVRDCLYGEVLRAVEVGHGGHFAIKVRRCASAASSFLNFLSLGYSARTKEQGGWID